MIEEISHSQSQGRVFGTRMAASSPVSAPTRALVAVRFSVQNQKPTRSHVFQITRVPVKGASLTFLDVAAFSSLEILSKGLDSFQITGFSTSSSLDFAENSTTCYNTSSISLDVTSALQLFGHSAIMFQVDASFFCLLGFCI